MRWYETMWYWTDNDMKQCDIWYWTDIKWLLTSHNSLAYFQWHWKYAKELWDDMIMIMIWYVKW